MKVMIFGTFDLLHEGHKFFIREAKMLGDKLIIVIARDMIVQKLKGHLPQEPETIRYEKVSALELADKVILGDLRDHLKTVREERPDIILLGYDQTHFVDTLQRDLQDNGLSATKIIRARAYEPQRYKTSLLRKQGI
jgi:FAD synthetase